jgi:hypothetical protein
MYEVMQKIVCRWNTDFYMLERCLLIKESLKIMLLKCDDGDLPELTKEDWLTAEDLAKILAPLESACKDLCGEKYSTSSRVIPTIGEVIEQLENETFSKHAQKSKNVILEQIKSRFRDIEKNEIASVATLLDPRFKTLGFADESMANRAILAVKNMMKNMSADVHKTSSEKKNASPAREVSLHPAKKLRVDFDDCLQKKSI